MLNQSNQTQKGKFQPVLVSVRFFSFYWNPSQKPRRFHEFSEKFGENLLSKIEYEALEYVKRDHPLNSQIASYCDWTLKQINKVRFPIKRKWREFTS